MIRMKRRLRAYVPIRVGVRLLAGIVGFFLGLSPLQGLPTAAAGSLLWEVRSETGVVFLLGSIHVARPDLYPLDSRIEKAFDASDQLVVEINPDKMDPRETQMLMLRYGMYADGSTLDTKLSKEMMEKVRERLERAGLPLESVLPFKPWFVALTVSSVEFERLGLDPDYGIDLYFIRKAKETKPILELESLGEQIALLDGFSPEEQEAFLLYTLEDLDNLDGAVDDLIGAWAEGDSAAIEDILTQTVENRPRLGGIYAKLIDERNGRMLEKIEHYLDTPDSYFVVVGAGHLVGDQGLVIQLAARGHKVVRH